jgi:hypothetical protein
MAVWANVATAGVPAVAWAAVHLHGQPWVIAQVVLGEALMVASVVCCTLAVLPRVGGIGQPSGEVQRLWLVARAVQGFRLVRSGFLLPLAGLAWWLVAACQMILGR